MISAPDPDALLVALVLCPGAYSRNRFYSMYATPEGSAVRRRAALVRSIVAELAHPEPFRRGRIVAIDEMHGDHFSSLTYVVTSLGLRRSTLLTPLELSVIQYAVTRRVGGGSGQTMLIGKTVIASAGLDRDALIAYLKAGAIKDYRQMRVTRLP